MKTDKQWDSWERSTIATARSHGCEEIFDGNYTPLTPDEKYIFDAKQKFMHFIFEGMLLTDMGKYYVCQHETDYDAQEIFKSLSAHAKQSTQAAIDTADLLSYITTIKLHESKWHGGSHTFVLYWCDKLCVYEELVPQSNCFTHNVKIIMLQNTVSGILELNQVKVQSAHNIALGRKPLNFSSYKDLLLSAATTYDATQGLSKGRPQHNVYYIENFYDPLSDV